MSGLRPGVHVVRRDAGHVQVGLDPPGRVIVPRRRETLQALTALSAGRRPPLDSPAVSALLRSLAAAGLLADDTPNAVAPGTVRVLDRGLGLGGLVALLRQAGVRTSPGDDVPDLYVAAAPGPLPRAVVDDLVGEGAPHLVLAGTGRPGELRLGPLVDPGRTACLRCVDAHEAEHDPRRSLVLEQLAALPAPPPDPALVVLAAGWAAREATAFLAGRRPVTWSATVDLGMAAPVVRAWERHPHCGCGWDDLPY